MSWEQLSPKRKELIQLKKELKFKEQDIHYAWQNNNKKDLKRFRREFDEIEKEIRLNEDAKG